MDRRQFPSGAQIVEVGFSARARYAFISIEKKPQALWIHRGLHAFLKGRNVVNGPDQRSCEFITQPSGQREARADLPGILHITVPVLGAFIRVIAAVFGE